MLTSARKTMPALDYVSIIRSVYVDRMAMLAGAFASALATALTGYTADSLALYGVACAFIVLGLVRYASMLSFSKAEIGAEDADAAEYWENQAVLIGSVLALLYGLWCFIAIAIERDPFAELTSVALSIAVMVGVCARNFGLDRLVTMQLLFVVVPMALGFVLHGDPVYLLLAVLLVVLVGSYRKLAGDIRTILLSAVHGRVEASRLATELDMALATLEHGLVMLDGAGRVSIANAGAQRTFGQFGVKALTSRFLADLLIVLGNEGRLPRQSVERLTDMIERRRSGKVLLSLPNGSSYEVTVSARDQRVVLLFENISERIASEKRISFMARYDMLTGLPNRTYFGDLVAEDLEARRNGSADAAVGLMLVDMDDFKHVNDTFGHMVGDELLIQVSQRLRQALPAEAILARLGGDEFIVYRGSTLSCDGLAEDAQRLEAAFAKPFILDGLTLNVTVSMGLVTSTNRDDQLDYLLTKADLALYAAKGNGKAKSQFFHPQMDVDYQYRQRLKNDLRIAIEEGELTLAFQPLFDLNSRRVLSCEALARWEHPQLGSIPPSTFIPLAEEMGLVSRITAWMMENAAAHCAQWPGGVSVAVNVSARDFRDGDLLGMVDRALRQAGLPPERFEVEVTETAVIEEKDIAQAVLSSLAERGLAIALDDFGTGYSSLSYLNALPLTKLKIDSSFVADIVDNPRAFRLLASVARLGNDLDLQVVAEGIETQEQLDALLAIKDVQQVQGYFFSRPLPPRDIAELIGRLNAEPRPDLPANMVNRR